MTSVPKIGQAAALERLLGAQRELYNAGLEERIGAWRLERRSVSRFEQFRALTGWDHPLLEFGVCPARGTLTRLARAFGGFYRRVRNGEIPGFPRFISAARWDSVEYPDRSCWRIADDHHGVGRIHLQGVGAVRFRGAKQGVQGVPKTLTVRREGDRWRITVFCADVPATALDPSDAVVGIDVGVTELVATSDGELIGNPRPCAAVWIGSPNVNVSPPAASGVRCGAAKPPDRSDGCIARSPGNDAISPIRYRDASSTTSG